MILNQNHLYEGDLNPNRDVDFESHDLDFRIKIMPNSGLNHQTPPIPTSKNDQSVSGIISNNVALYYVPRTSSF